MPVVRLLWWLPGLAIRRLLLPIEAKIEQIVVETEAHLAEQE